MFKKVANKFLFGVRAIRLVSSSKGNLLYAANCFFSGVNPFGRVHMHHYNTLTGQIKFAGWVPNMVPQVGREWIADQISERQKAPMAYMAVGTGTNATDYADTALQTEIDRNALDEDYPQRLTGADGHKVLFQCTWAAGDGTGELTEAAIFNSPSAGDMLCRAVFGVKDKEPGDAIVMLWETTISS